MSAADLRSLLDAVAFAARAHRHQIRKDKQTPYVSHVFRVCLTVRHFFGIADADVLTAAVLHDTIEDTTTDFDDVAEHFSPKVAGWVRDLSKDKRLPDAEREQQYKAVLTAAPWQVQVCKLADIHDNLTDSVHTPPEMQARTRRRSHEYLEALRSGLKPEARAAFEIVTRLLAGMESAGDIP
jgi:guanosine-3',5'-bis(diphosphate) 3'-pyrophosphohydrolase